MYVMQLVVALYTQRERFDAGLHELNVLNSSARLYSGMYRVNGL